MVNWEYQSCGIPDDKFVRGDIPMTKEEVRAVAISKLRLKKDSIVYDIGAGTGSLTVEVALVAKGGRVYAIEREEEAINLINNNLDQFKLNNVEVIHQQAPKGLQNLPEVDRVIVGGSGGQLEEILKIVDNKLQSQGRVVVNAITLNTLNTAINTLEKLDYQLDICNIAVSKVKAVGNYHMLQGLNPIYIISGQKG